MMIRRIVDSVSLMVDAGSHHGQESFPVTSINDSLDHSSQEPDKLISSDSDECSPHANSVLPRHVASTLSRYSVSSHSSPLAVTQRSSDEQDSRLFGMNDRMAETLTSRRFIPELSATRPRSLSSPERVHYTRRHSPSPGRPTNLTAFANCQLPGESVLNHRRSLRSQLVSQQLTTASGAARKKELNKVMSSGTGGMKQPKSTLIGKTSKPDTPSGDITNEEVGKMDVMDLDACGTFCQADSLVISVECMVLPFVNDFNEVELRVDVERLSQAQRRLLKMLAHEHNLIILSPPKTASHSSTLVLRKRAALMKRQEEEQMRRKREAEERARQLALEEETRLRLLREEEEEKNTARTGPEHRETCCQTDAGHNVGRKKYRRLRNERRRLLARAAQSQPPKKPVLVDGSMQTVPEDYALCSWCLQHIAPDAQCGHEAICRAGYKQKILQSDIHARLVRRNKDADTRKRLRLGLPTRVKERNSHQNHSSCATGTDVATSARSRSRLAIREKKLKKGFPQNDRARSSSHNARSAHPNQTSISAKLDAVHPNDVDGMVRLMQRLCVEPKCNQLAVADTNAAPGGGSGGVKCQNCRRIYCSHHRPVGMHAACPAVSPDTTPGIHDTDQRMSMACGMDAEEKRAHLKSIMRQRLSALAQRRQGY